jgi:MFS family permease
MALSGVHSFASLILVYMGLISLSYQAGVMDATMAIPSNWFVRHRVMAMAWMSASIGLGSLLVTPILAYTVHTWGWRYGALVAGIAFHVIGIPVTLPLVRSPETIGLSPDRDPDPAGSQAEVRLHDRNENEFSLAQALHTWQFWLLMAATTLRVFCTSTITVHFVPIMTWKGLSQAHAALLLSVAAFLALPADMIVGWLADRFNRSRVMASAMLVSMLGVVIPIDARDEWQLWLYLVLFAETEAVFPATWSAVVDFFGRSNFAKIRGAMSFIYTWGGVLGPVAAGFLNDRTQYYRAILWTLVVSLAVASGAYTILTKPQIPEVMTHG